MANSKKTKAEVVETEVQPEVTEAEVKPEAVEEVAAAEPVAAEPVLEVAAEGGAEEAATTDIAEEKPQSDEPSFGKKFAAGAKERFRKFLVSLKRNPQRIPLVFMVIVSFIWLIWLFTFSRSVSRYVTIEWAGLSVFVNTLLSVLILALFFSAFPKRKKPNVVMIVLLFVFMAAMVGMDILYYLQVHDFAYTHLDAPSRAKVPFVVKSLDYAIAHIALQAISALILALYPVYKRLLLKINTKKEIAGNDIKEAIDMEEE